MNRFTTKRESKKRNSDFSFANERWQKTQSSGFTLIETMVAISILTLSIAGPLYTASRAIVAAETARDQLTASYLAQEGIEYVRMMRDDVFLATYQEGGPNVSSTAWTNFITGGSPASITACRASTCLLDPALLMGTGSNLSLQPCSGAVCAPLHLSNGIYTQQQIGTVKPFTRTIQVLDASPSGATDVRIVSTVSWDFHGTPYFVIITDHLTPWQ